jgi:FKBP-type peptidyl-prolyl cis-trans isomerase 2
VQLILQSIIISPTKRQCTINGEIFKPGEEAEVMSGTTKIKVRVVEIRKSSVLIDANGESKELRLPE